MTPPYDFKTLITGHESTRNQMITDYQSYCGKVGILNRTMPDSYKVNNKLANDFRGEIVDQITGYLFGRPITYSLKKEAYEDGLGMAAYERDNAELNAWRIRVEAGDLDAEAGKRAAIMGSTIRLCYNDTDGNANVVNLFPWQVIVIDEHNAIIYRQDATSGKYTVEHYDDTFITTYIEGDDGEFYLDADNPPIPHMFALMPIVEIVYNDEKLPAFRKVESLIDAYDRALSDAQNEIEEFRLAYLKIIGAEPLDEDEAARIRQTGSISVPEGGDVDFLTKTIDDDVLEHHKETLRENIYRFSATVDMTDQKFSGSDQSGEARKWKLLALENKASVLERKFSKALRQQFKILSTHWQAKGYALDWQNIDWTIHRNIPLELSMEAQITSLLRGNVTERTRLGLLSFIDDPEREIKEMQAESSVDLDSVKVDEGDDDE